MTKRSLKQPAVIGIGVFAIALGIAVFMSVFTYRQSSESVRAEFEVRADSLAAQISRELEVTVATIAASASALRLGGDTDGDALREQLYAYLKAGDVLASSPAIRNIGLVMNGGYGRADLASPAFTLIGIYPDTTSSLIGADLSFSRERMAAIEYAQGSGRAGVGDRINLLSGTPGVFFAFPIYSAGPATSDPAERKARTIGMIVAVLSTESFMSNALSELDLRGVDFELHDLGADTASNLTLGPKTVLASSVLEDLDYSDLSEERLLISFAPDAIQRDVRVGGHTWRILMARKSEASIPLALGVALAITGVGFVLSSLAGFATFQQLSHSASLARSVQERTLDLRKANSRITKQANQDELTGLGNRRSLAVALEEMIEGGDRSDDALLAAVHIDLDRFKQINDTMGHAGGDFVLRHVAKLIQAAFPDGAFCARVGGDEFTVAAILDAERAADLIAAAHRLVASCNEVVIFEGRACRFGASVGIATQPLSEAEPNTLLVNADLALYRAKGEGRGRIQLFSPEIQAQVIAYKNRSDDILRAIEAGDEFTPFFQPQICAKTGRLYGVEALARWAHPELGLLPPSEFLPIAEDLDVVAQIDRAILESAIQAMNRAFDNGFSVPHLSTNLSFSRLMDNEFIASISDLPPCQSSISFEILESVFLDDEEGPAMWNIDSIRNAGMEVQIDDFGSGRASVVALTRIAPNRMKIDRELVAPIAILEERLRLVQSIVEIGKVLGIGVTAEGVETREQADLLIEMGCDVLQGFFFAEPMSEADLFDYLRAAKTAAA